MNPTNLELNKLLNKKVKRSVDKIIEPNNNEDGSGIEGDQFKEEDIEEFLYLENQFKNKKLNPDKLFVNGNKIFYIWHGKLINQYQLNAFLKTFENENIFMTHSLNSFEKNTNVKLIIYEIYNDITDEELDFIESILNNHQYTFHKIKIEDLVISNENIKINDKKKLSKHSINQKEDNSQEITIKTEYLLITSLHNAYYYKETNKRAYDLIKKFESNECYLNFFNDKKRECFYMRLSLIQSKKLKELFRSLHLEEKELI